MTYLPAAVIGMWFHLYLILDLYSRKIVGWEVHDRDDADHAAHLVRRTALAEGIAACVAKPVLHGDNGATLKATTVLAMLHWLGIKPSYSRPRVSDDNAYAEALFRTAKYRPEFEPPRLSRRLIPLRGLSNEKVSEVFPRGSGAGGSDGAGALVRARFAVGGDPFDQRQVRLYGRDVAALGATGGA